jgi:hypothetical protein
MVDPVTPPIEARIVDVHMPFGSMVAFMVKWSIAAIPAILILALVGAAVAGLVAGMLHR